jgi:hypothetical protein
MTNSKKSAKSKGVVLFAFNSAVVDYVTIADRVSKLIKKNLNLPVTLITDPDANPTFEYDHIVRAESKDGNFRFGLDGEVYQWKNFDRYRAYALSPYDETLLIDTDYLVLDDSLLKLFDQSFDYRLMHKMQTPQESNKDEMGPLSLPMVWATVVLFRKSPKAEMFFDLVGRIQRNYNYYRNLFGIREGNFRNDFAFSISNIIMNGYAISAEQSIPWPMTTIEEIIDSMTLRNKFLIVKYSEKAHVISRQNLHIMDKGYLLSEQFNQFVESICHD